MTITNELQAVSFPAGNKGALSVPLTHRRRLGAASTLCGARVPKTIAAHAIAPQCRKCWRMHSPTPAQLSPARRMGGKISHEEVADALRRFRKKGGEIERAEAPPPSVPVHTAGFMFGDRSGLAYGCSMRRRQG